MIKIGGLALGVFGSDPIWVDRYASTGVEQTVRRTLGGRAVVYTGSLVGGLPVTLQAADDQGWLTKAQADSLLALAAVPGAVYTLEIDATVFSVMFDNSSGSAVDLRPQVSRTTQVNEDYFVGQIKLMTV